MTDFLLHPPLEAFVTRGEEPDTGRSIRDTSVMMP